MNEQTGITELPSARLPISGLAGRKPPDRGPGLEIPQYIASVIKDCRNCLGAVSQMLRCLSVAAAYDRTIDSASTGVAEVARRMIDETTKQLDGIFEKNSNDEGEHTNRGALT